MCTALQKHLRLLCWRAANKHPISRSILSLQTLHIFNCAEEYFPAAICLLCFQNMQSASNMVWICTITPFYLFLFFHKSHEYYCCATSRFKYGCRRHGHTPSKECTRHVLKGSIPLQGMYIQSACLHCLTSFLPSLLLFYQLPFSYSHSVFHYDIHCVLFRCKQALISFYVCSCTVVPRGRVLWTQPKSGQSPILLIILHYNGRHPQMWMTFTATPMTVREHSSYVLESVEACTIY